MARRESSLEDLGIEMFNQVFKNRKVLITGHNGFKGSWLTQWLSLLNAEIFGLALPPLTNPNHWDLLKIKLKKEFIIDINNFDEVKNCFENSNPEIVFHLAAQSLVKEGFISPLNTWSTNVLGTANILECCRLSKSVKAVVVITTDKCYENKEWVWGYRENDKLGGKDPYSASKSSSELVVESYKHSILNPNNKIKYATARAGNVIGGGDWSTNRLIPDAIRSIIRGDSIELRAPYSTRPWQHVLDCISGYLLLAENLYLKGDEYTKAWNFGPDDSAKKSVEEVIIDLKKHIHNLTWHIKSQQAIGESGQLHLDSSLVKTKQGWKPVWNYEKSIFKILCDRFFDAHV